MGLKLRQEKRAIFGGSFNPIHRGHLAIAEVALHQFDLDQIIWVPTYHPPHKAMTELAGFHHRLAMVRQAIADYPAFVCSAIEADHQPPSYAINTLTSLQTQFPSSAWYWIMGWDTFKSLPHWRSSEELIAQCCWLVAPRASSACDPNLISEQCSTTTSKDSHLTWHSLDMPVLDFSSSEIRLRCRQGQSISDRVPDPVNTYIDAHGLYQLKGDKPLPKLLP